ncbi:MAG: SPFH domain-containing protein, partial [Rhizobiaceae bacterium]
GISRGKDMLEIWIGIIVTAIVVIAILYIISIWVYKRAPANIAFIRTGLSGTKVCVGKGAIVLPVFHDVSWISLESIKLIITRARDQAVLTSDNIRIDVTAELYTHVGRNDDDVLTASRSLGEKTFDAEKIRNLLEAKVVGAIRSYAATKTLKELHENRDVFAQELKSTVTESFRANGLELEEVTIVALEQASKEFFRSDNIFDAEGLKIITEITSDSRKKVHDTEKKTTVAIRQKDLDTELEILDIERREAIAKATQDKDIANEQARQLGEKQVYMLDQRKVVENQEISVDVELERARTDREVAISEEARKRESIEIQRNLAIESEQRDKEIALTAKSRELEVADIEKAKAIEMADKQRQVELASSERERRKAEIERETEIAKLEETARDERNNATEKTDISVRARQLETRLAVLEYEKTQTLAENTYEREVAEQKAKELAEQQKYILQQRWEVQNEEIQRELALEQSQIDKEVGVTDAKKQQEAAEVRRKLALEIEETEREIALINKEREREAADIQRASAREQEERNREIIYINKTKELEQTEIDRLEVAREREQAEYKLSSVGPISEAERRREIERIVAEQNADTIRISEEAQAEIARMHAVTQAEGRKQAATHEADAVMTRAKSNSDAQKISAEGIEQEAAARGKAETAVEQLRIQNAQRRLEAEAVGLEAKAGALKKYNDAGMFLELARLQIEAERDVHIDQAKAMGHALSEAQIRMYGDGDGTMDTIRGMFTSGFALGEVLEGVAQSLPDGLRERFTKNGIRGIFGRPYRSGEFKEMFDQLSDLVQKTMRTKAARQVAFGEAMAKLESAASGNEGQEKAIAMLRDANEAGVFDDVEFELVWTLLQSTAKAAD